MTDDGGRSVEKNAAAELGESDALRANIAKGMADLRANRVTDFDLDRIVERGKAILAERGGFDA